MEIYIPYQPLEVRPSSFGVIGLFAANPQTLKVRVARKKVRRRIIFIVLDYEKEIIITHNYFIIK